MSKSFGPTQALAPLTLEIPQGEIHALLGENGSGKSTFIKCLSGYHRADSGEAFVCGEPLVLGSPTSSHSLGCRFVHQDLGLIATESVLDNLCVSGGYETVFGTINGRAARRSAAADLERAGIDIDPRRLVASLSPAEQTAVAVARALRPEEGSQPRLLVLDEPTARLPEREVAQLLDTVRLVASGGVAVIYVSHRIDEVFEVAQAATVLRDGWKVATRQVAELDHRALVELLVGGALEEVRADANFVPVANVPPVFKVEEVSSDKLKRVTFEVHRGEVVGLAGITGSGREVILSTLFGGLPRGRGSVTANGVQVQAERPDLSIAAGIAYLPPDRKVSGAVIDATARENLMLADVRKHWKWPFLRSRAEKSEARTWFRRLNVRPGDRVDRPMATFSGGNQQKILFGKWLRTEPVVLLLDEPTQGVDIATKAELHKEVLALAASGSGVVVSSSDGEELVEICHRILVMLDGRIVAELSGDDKTEANMSHTSFGTNRGISA